jgi:hypothetical protein
MSSSAGWCDAWNESADRHMLRSLLLSLLGGALVALLGWGYLGLPVKDRERLKRPMLVVAAVLILLGLAIMIWSLMFY